MPRERFFRVLLVMGSALTALGMVELTCRAVGIGSPNPHLTDESGLFIPDPDPEISYRLKPGFEGSVYGSFVRINSRGLRESDSVDYGPHDTAFRILCLGDSVVFGFGAPQKQSFPAVVENLLNRKRSAHFQVVNAGVPGYNTVQEVRFLEVEGYRYLPDLVLLFLVINDPEGIRKLDAEGHLLPVPEDIWLRLSREYPSFFSSDTFLYSYNALRRVWMPFTARYRHIVQEAVKYQTQEIFENPGWTACRQALVRLHKWGEAHGTPVVPILLPVLTDFNHHPYTVSYQRFATACTDSGLTPIDAFPALRRYDPDRLRLHPEDGHPGVYGHRVIADFVVDTLTRHSFWRSSDE